MSDDIKANVDNLVNAINHGNDAEAQSALTVLVGGALIDLRIIANAVEKLSNFKLERVGDVVLGSAEQTEGLDLTVGEAQIIEQLRAGDIRVVSRERRAIQLYRDHVARERERGIKMEMVPWAQVPAPTKTLWRQEAELDTGKGVKT